MKNPKFSVLMSLYIKEKAAYFDACMQSMLWQTVQPSEIVIVEDGPIAEDVRVLLNKYIEQNPGLIKTVPLEQNRGLGLALAEGILHCSYELIARMDTDDIAREDRFEKQLAAFAEDPALDICGSYIQEFEGTPDNVLSVRKVPLSHEGIAKYQKQRCAFNHVTVMYKKSAVLKAGNYKDAPLMEDDVLWVDMLRSGAKCRNLDECLVYVRTGREMISRRGGYSVPEKILPGEKTDPGDRIHQPLGLLENSFCPDDRGPSSGETAAVGISKAAEKLRSGVDVSVVVPFRNEEKYLDHLLQCLCKQTYPEEKMEWLLIDGKSTDGSREIVEKYMSDHPILLLDNPKRHTPDALNLGIQNARGKYIIRMDAHSGFPEDYIEKCIQSLEKTGADNVGGVARTKGEGPVGKAIASVLASPFGVGNAKFRTDGKSGYVDTVPFGTFRREIFDKVGLFDTELLRSEDTDLNARIRAAGGKIWLSREIQFEYYCRNSVGAFIKMALKNGNALFWTIRRNPKAMQPRHYIPFLFFSSLFLLPILGVWLRPCQYFLLAELALYLALDMWFSFSDGCSGTAVRQMWLYPLLHICYGFGSFLSFLGIKAY